MTQRLVLVVLFAASLAVAACAGGGTSAGQSTGGGGAVQQVAVKAVTGLKFDQAALTVRSGSPVHLTLNDTDSVLHDWTVDSLDGKKVTVQANPGQSASVDFTPSTAGSYEFYCSQPGHKEAGMKGTLTVQ